MSEVFLFWDSVFFQIFRDIHNTFFSCLGISCLLLFEWIRNALLFFWSEDFLFWDSVFFSIFGGYRGFSPYAKFITANFITAVYQNIP